MSGDRGSNGRGRGSILNRLLHSSAQLPLPPPSETQDVSQQAVQSDVAPMGTSGTGRGRLISQLSAAQQQLQVGSSQQDSLQSDVRPLGRGRSVLLSLLPTAQQPSQVGPPQPDILQSDVRPRGRGRTLQDMLSQRSVAGSSTTSIVPASIPQEVPHVSLTRGMRQLQLEQSSAERGPPIVQKGTYGTILPATANYIRLELEPGKGVFRYEVIFKPFIEDERLKTKLLRRNDKVLGRQKTFDGSNLYLPIKLPEEVTKLNTVLEDGSSWQIEIKFKIKLSPDCCAQQYGSLLHRIHKALELVKINRQSFDPHAAQTILEHKLELFPGYQTAIAEYEGGLMLCMNSEHRVLRTETCLEFMQSIMNAHRGDRGGSLRTDPSDDIKHFFLGKTVMTRYNYKTYKITDVDFTSNPDSTFDTSDGRKISYYDYFEQQHGIKLKYRTQAMLVNLQKIKIRGNDISRNILLPPEVCHLTGITDDMRNNFNLMKALHDQTALTPEIRHRKFMNYIQRIRENEKACELLRMWGLRIADNTVDLNARQMPKEDIYFGNGKVQGPDFGRDSTNLKCLHGVNFIRWVVLFASRDKKNAENFQDCITKLGVKLGINICNPIMIQLRSDQTDDYMRELRSAKHQDVQFFVIIFPSQRDDRYSAVKRVLCTEVVKPSQVIISKTISRQDRLRSVVYKIALQINCKLGGSLWSINNPFKQLVMFVGIDSYHDPTGRNRSVFAVVSSMDKDITKWYSKVVFNTAGQEVGDSLRKLFVQCIQRFYNINGNYPTRVIVFRDGVGDGDLRVIKNHEIPQILNVLEQKFQNMYFTYVVVQKRINTRLFVKARGYENPKPGTVVDNTVTRRDWYDFFLVSQSVRQGTVVPTHYIVVYDNAETKPDVIQSITYKLCHMYYNWSGTIRVPAPCLNSHKLAYLVGQNIGTMPHDDLADKLYYLN